MSLFVTNRVIVNPIPPPPFDICIDKRGPRASPYELCDPPVVAVGQPWPRL
jgi:hypothetical protein